MFNRLKILLTETLILMSLTKSKLKSKLKTNALKQSSKLNVKSVKKHFKLSVINKPNWNVNFKQKKMLI